jgi:hypothetical protein
VPSIEQSTEPISDTRKKQLREIRSIIQQDKQLTEFNSKEDPAPAIQNKQDKEAEDERRARHQRKKEEERAARKAAEK